MFIKNINTDEIRDGFIVTSQTKKLWNALLETCYEVSNICAKHNITYWGAFGTLLGAQQYNGFIPWDDDMDINMFRPDYNLFYDVIKRELNKKFFEISLYTPFFIKICYRNGTYINNRTSRITEDEIYKLNLDITPLDISWSDNDQIGIVKQMFDLRKQVMRAKYEDNIVEFSQANKLCEQVFHTSSVVNEVKRFSKGHPKSLYSTTIYKPFELFELPCPVGYKQICHHYYGGFKRKVDDYHNPLNGFFIDVPMEQCKQQLDFNL